MKFDKDPLAIEQNNYLCQIVNVYIVYDLDARPKNSTNREKYVYSGYGITFDSAVREILIVTVLEML